MIFGERIIKVKRITKHHILKKILVVLFAFIGLILLINLPIITLRNNKTNTDYSDWMSENISYDKKVIDVAMLGAHDAFTQDMNIMSKLDPYETNSIMQGTTGFLVKGFIYRQSKTQLATATELLQSGVRYLDIRLSLDGDKWYTKHNYISEEFDLIAEEITEFLDNYPGEFLILDFQHIDGVDYNDVYDYNLFYNMLDEYGLLEYAYNVNQLDSLTYGQLTNNGTVAKIIIISKFTNSNTYVLSYDDSIRSNWADSDDFDFVINNLHEEANDIDESSSMNKFRVMQAVTTMQISGSGILDALGNWSLINRAKRFNSYLIDSEDFDNLLIYLPIIMVDYANTNANQFNDKIMQKIMDFNRNSWFFNFYIKKTKFREINPCIIKRNLIIY